MNDNNFEVIQLYANMYQNINSINKRYITLITNIFPYIHTNKITQ